MCLPAASCHSCIPREASLTMVADRIFVHPPMTDAVLSLVFRIGRFVKPLPPSVMMLLISILIARADEHRIVLARLVIDSQVAPLLAALSPARTAERHRSRLPSFPIGQRIEEIHDGASRRIDTVGGYQLTREGQPCSGSRGAIADSRKSPLRARRGRNGGPAAAEGALTVEPS